LARLAYGGRIDLSLATITVVIPLTFGTIVGALAGYFGGWFDLMVMRVADVVAAFPFFVLVITLVFVLGSGVKSIIIAISLVGWIAYARIVRAETLVVRGREYVDACRSGGLPASRIIARHIIPNSASQAVIYAMSDMVLNIGVIVTLSYFGLGITPPTSDWGRMISDGQQFLTSGRYALVLIPGAAVILTSLALSLIGDGLVSILRGKR
jgi:peptide/nickel transport system permease protein